MGNLTSKPINETFDGLLKTADENALPATGRVVIQDGLGNDTALSIGRAGEGIAIDGPIEGITGGGVEAKEFSLSSITPPTTDAEPWIVNFLIEGNCTAIKVKIFLGASNLPVYSTTISNPVNGQDIQIGASQVFNTGIYNIFFEAEFSDNTSLTDVSVAAVINDPMLNIEILSVQQDYRSDTSLSYVAPLIQQYTRGYITNISQKPSYEFVNWGFLEFKLRVRMEPFDLITASSQDSNSSVMTARYAGNTSFYQALQFVGFDEGQYFLNDIGSNEYEIIYFVGDFPSLWNVLPIKDFEYSISGNIDKYSLNRTNQLVASSVEGFSVPFTGFDFSSLTTPREFEFRYMGYVSSSSRGTEAARNSITVGIYCQNLVSGGAIDYALVERDTQVVLEQDNVSYSDYQSNKLSHTIYYPNPLQRNVAYQVKVTVEQTGVSPFTYIQEYQILDYTVGLSITSSSSTNVDYELSLTDWNHHYAESDIRFVIVNDSTLEETNCLLKFPNDDEDFNDILVARTDYYRYPSVNLTTQTVTGSALPNSALLPGSYTLKCEGFDYYDHVDDLGIATYRELATAQFTIS